MSGERSGVDESGLLDLCLGFWFCFFFFEPVLFALVSAAVTKGTSSSCGLTNTKTNGFKEFVSSLSVQTSYFIYCTKLSLCPGAEYQCSVTYT